ncbi:hypothetical protein GQ600_9637 [Phytophthora cactorum]|nr:hypothetical protein GQ600_9637 [Phytophthora cactorum]
MVTARKFRLGSLLCKHLLQRWNTLSPSWMKTWQRSSLAHRPLEVRPPVGCTTISLHCALRCGRWARGLGEGKGDRITLKYPPTRFLLPHWVSLSFAQTKEPLRWCHCPILWTPDIELALALSPADSLSRDGVFNSTPATRINTCSLYCAWGGLIQALNACLATIRKSLRRFAATFTAAPQSSTGTKQRSASSKWWFASICRCLDKHDLATKSN